MTELSDGDGLAPTTGDPAESDRSVLLTVDDDPSVSRSVARDLRRRYGERHRVVRATLRRRGDGGPA